MLGLIWVQKSLVFQGCSHLKSVMPMPAFGCLQPFLLSGAGRTITLILRPRRKRLTAQHTALAAGRLHYLGVQPFVHWEHGILEVVAVDAVLADALDADTGLAVVQQQAVAAVVVGAQLPQQGVDSFRLLRCDFDDHWKNLLSLVTKIGGCLVTLFSKISAI